MISSWLNFIILAIAADPPFHFKSDKDGEVSPIFVIAVLVIWLCDVSVEFLLKIRHRVSEKPGCIRDAFGSHCGFESYYWLGCAPVQWEIHHIKKECVISYYTVSFEEARIISRSFFRGILYLQFCQKGK